MKRTGRIDVQREFAAIGYEQMSGAQLFSCLIGIKRASPDGKWTLLLALI
jgi:hypothetical protein